MMHSASVNPPPTTSGGDCVARAGDDHQDSQHDEREQPERDGQARQSACIRVHGS